MAAFRSSAALLTPRDDDAARAAFDASKDAQTLHRYQNQSGRALLQTLKAVAALRPAIAAEPPAATEPNQTTETQDKAPAAAAEQSQDEMVNLQS